MADTPFPIPESWPESDAFTEHLGELRREWPFEEVNIPTLETLRTVPQSSLPHKRIRGAFLKGYWTTYPTYCLIAYPFADDAYFLKRNTLKKVLIACHLLLLQGIAKADKHYQSRLQASFRAYRQLYEKRHQETLALLPSKAETLAEYERAVTKLLEQRDKDEILQAINLALEGAIEGRGGHTRTVTPDDANKTVGQSEQPINHEAVSGRLIRNRKKINSEHVTTANRLAREESGTGPVLYQPDSSISPEFGESVYQVVRAAKGHKASLMRLNQLLAFGWSRLSLIDIRGWFDNLTTGCEKISPNYSMDPEELQALCCLMFWTGRPAATIHDLRVITHFSNLPEGTLRQGYIVYDLATAVFPKLHPDGAKEVSAKWRSYVRDSSDRLIIPLPHAAREHMCPWLDKRAPTGKKGKRLFMGSITAYQSAIDDLLSLIRKKYGARLTATRLTRQLSISLANQCGDRVRAAAALGVPVGNQTTTGLYYYTSTQAELASVYWQTSAPLSDHLVQSSVPEPLPSLPPEIGSIYVGTNVCPDDGGTINQEHGFYWHHAQDLRDALAYCRSRMHNPGFTVAFHNAFTSYCVAMLGALTGYRAVKNPLTNIHALDESTGFLVISDKDFDDYRNARLTWVPPVLHAQLRAYAMYRAYLVRCLQLENDNPAFFFFLNDDRRTKPVTPQSLADSLRWSSELPLNANRHYLRTRLAEKRVPGEIIDAFMGHWDLGEEPYGPYSALSPADFKAAISPTLTSIVAEQGWREEHVIDPAIAPNISPDIGFDTNTAPRASAKRPVKPTRDRERDLERLNDLFLDVHRRLITGNTSNPPIYKAIDALFRNVRADPDIHDWRFVHNRLVRRLCEGKKEHGWPIVVPSPVAMLNQTPAPFTPDLFRGLAEFRQIEQRYIDSLRKLDPTSSNINGVITAYVEPFQNSRSRWTPDLSAFLVGQILFAAARYGGLLSRNALQELLKQLPAGGMVIRNHLVFDLNQRALTRRWYADPLSCTLISRYRSLVERGTLTGFSRSVDEAVQAIVRGLTGKAHRLEKLPAFIKSAAIAWQLVQPAYVYRWARNAASSCSWDESTEIRVRFDRRICPDKHESSVTRDPFDVDALVSDFQQPTPSKESHPDLNRAYRAFYDCLSVDKGSSWRGQIARQTQTWLETNQAQIGPVAKLFVQWTRAIVLRQAHAHQTIGAASSLRTYVSRIGRTLFIESKAIRPDQFQEIDAWKELYQSIVESKKGPRARMLAAAECQSFHNYVVRRMDVPTLAVGETVGTGPTDVNAVVNANYVTPFELERAAALLNQGAQRNRNYETARHVLELGYWSGLRIGELLGLRLRDIQIAWTDRGRFKRVEILCRAHSRRALKSNTSTRRVAISCLMPKESLGRFVRFVMQRDGDWDGFSKKGARFLFSNSELGHTLPDEQQIRGLVQLALRQVTGDETLVFHHLRHSAANNMLIALTARSDDDPIWDLFPRRPEALVDVSRRINRGLMVNTTRRRGILHAIETVLGHVEPNTTLQSYIHILPWICATQIQDVGESEHYLDLERDVELDSSLLAKSENAARSLRSRNDNEGGLQSLADHWLKKFRTRAAPTLYKYSETPLPNSTQEFIIPPRPLPSFSTIYLVALFIYQIEMRESRACTNAELSRIARQTAMPLWLTTNLRHEMLSAFAEPARRPDVRSDREGHHNRYQATRSQYFRGHGRADLSVLDQCPELFGLMPAMPRTKADLAACNQVWTGLSNLLEKTGRWQALNNDPEAQPDPEADCLLSTGLQIFMERTNSSDHTLKFFGYGFETARLYIAFAKRIYPHNRILVEIKPAGKNTAAKSLAKARQDLGLNGCASRAIKRAAKHLRDWPYGIPSVRLLSGQADFEQPKSLHNSYGAWFAQYSFALLYRTLCQAQSFSDIFHVNLAAKEEKKTTEQL